MAPPQSYFKYSDIKLAYENEFSDPSLFFSEDSTSGGRGNDARNCEATRRILYANEKLGFSRSVARETDTLTDGFREFILELHRRSMQARERERKRKRGKIAQKKVK